MEDKYLLKIKDAKYTIPSQNIIELALIKAMDLKVTNIPLKTGEQAIKFLESLGIKISEVKA